MAEYQLLLDPMTRELSGTVKRRSDNAFIPDDGGNRDRQIYVEWCEAGGVADPPDPLPDPVNAAPTPAEHFSERIEALEARVTVLERRA